VLVAGTGIEPVTLALSRPCSAAELTGCVAGDDGLEPPRVGIKIRCLTNLANPQQNVASRQGFEPRPTVLETAMLPLNTSETFFYALMSMRVLKHTKS
jgi:hypothetical protein